MKYDFSVGNLTKIIKLTKCLPAIVGMKVAFMNQGKPRHRSISKVLEPIELLIPIDPCPKIRYEK